MTLAAPLAYPEAEQAVLGALLLAPERLIEVRPTLTAESFTSPLLARVWTAYLRMSDRGEAIDHITLARELPGHEVDLADLIDAAVTTANLSHHAALLADATQRRYAVRLADRLIARARDAGTPLADSLAGMVSAVAQVVTDGPFKPPTFTQVLGNVIESLGKPPAHGQTQGIPSGLRGLDAILDGLGPGLHVFAGNPSEGKSSLARAAALTAAEHGPVLFSTLEMTQEEVAKAMLEYEVGKSMKWVCADSARLDSLMPRIIEASGRLASLPITIIEGMETPSALRMAWQAECALGRTPALVVVDYLQLMRGDGKYHENRTLEIGTITREFKRWSTRERVPILVLSQFSRENKKGAVDKETRQMKPREPELVDLRDSGSIEQDANTVTMLYLPFGRPDSGTWQVDLLVRKNRSGPTGRVRVEFEPWTYRYRDMTP